MFFFSKLLLLFGQNKAYNAENQANDRPDVKVGIAAGANQREQTSNDIKTSTDITTFSAGTGANGHDAGNQQANCKKETGSAANFPIAAEGVAKPGCAGLHSDQNKQNNADNADDQFPVFHNMTSFFILFIAV